MLQFTRTDRSFEEKPHIIECRKALIKQIKKHGKLIKKEISDLVRKEKSIVSNLPAPIPPLGAAVGMIPVSVVVGSPDSSHQNHQALQRVRDQIRALQADYRRLAKGTKRATLAQLQTQKNRLLQYLRAKGYQIAPDQTESGPVSMITTPRSVTI